MRILVCGGRDFVDTAFVFRQLNQLNDKRGPITEVIHGGATGADFLAGSWALHHGVRETVVRPDWKTFGKLAGPLRNSAMLKLEPDVVVAFPGGRGTADMVRKALEAGRTVISYKPDYMAGAVETTITPVE